MPRMKRTFGDTASASRLQALVFDAPLSATREDPYPYEQWWRTVGGAEPQVVTAVHTWPDFDTGMGRIISARKATRHERKAYEEGLD